MSAPIPRFAYSFTEGCKVVGIGKTKAYDEIKTGKLKARKNGRLTQFLPADLLEYVEALPVIEPRGDHKPAATEIAKADTSERRRTAKVRRHRVLERTARASRAPPGDPP
jgi:hypothetical protein